MRASVPVQSGDPQSLRSRHGRLSRQQQPTGERQHQALLDHHHRQPGEPGDEGCAAAEDLSACVIHRLKICVFVLLLTDGRHRLS